MVYGGVEDNLSTFAAIKQGNLLDMKVRAILLLQMHLRIVRYPVKRFG